MLKEKYPLLAQACTLCLIKLPVRLVPYNTLKRKKCPYGFVPPAGASILLVPLLGKLVACAEKNARTASYLVLFMVEL